MFTDDAGESKGRVLISSIALPSSDNAAAAFTKQHSFLAEYSIFPDSIAQLGMLSHVDISLASQIPSLPGAMVQQVQLLWSALDADPGKNSSLILTSVLTWLINVI
jgi:hypothetical protein